MKFEPVKNEWFISTKVAISNCSALHCILTMRSISLATISKCSTASPLMTCLSKLTFQKRSVWRVTTHSSCSKWNNQQNINKISCFRFIYSMNSHKNTKDTWFSVRAWISFAKTAHSFNSAQILKSNKENSCINSFETTEKRLSIDLKYYCHK